MENKNIDIQKVREFKEDQISKKINEINGPNIEPDKKRLYVLNLYNSSNIYSDSIDFPNNKKQIFDINKVRDYRETIINEKIKNLKNEKLSKKQKRLFVLDEMNTSSSSNDKEEEEGNIENREKKKEIIKVDLKEEYNPSLLCESISTDYSSSISALEEEKKNYWLDNKLYDVYDTAIKNEYFKCLTLITLEKNKNCFVYKNDLITYYFIKSFQFGEFFINNDILTDNQYNKSHGLFFCGNKIELENNEIKKCCPNEMICKQCMEKNKKRYKIKDKYLININGRVAKKYKKKIHCFGHFIIGNQIEDCLSNFSCKACQLLEQHVKYYFPS